MAYNVATFTRVFANAAGTAFIEITYTGNAGEPPVADQLAQNLTTSPTADFIRGIAIARLSNLNTTKNFITGALPFVGTVLDTTTPLPPPAASTFGSFVATSGPFTPGTAPTDIATLYGSATRTVNVTRVCLTTIQTTAGINAWSLIKRSAANTGGTSSAMTKVPLNTAYPAATAAVLQYSANPSALGAAVGNVYNGRVLAPALTSLTAGPLDIPLFGSTSPTQPPIVLSGTGQGLAINFGGVALPSGLSVQVSFWWTEQ